MRCWADELEPLAAEVKSKESLTEPGGRATDAGVDLGVGCVSPMLKLARNQALGLTLRA
jgi:hypothetical protein